MWNSSFMEADTASRLYVHSCQQLSLPICVKLFNKYKRYTNWVGVLKLYGNSNMGISNFMFWVQTRGESIAK